MANEAVIQEIDFRIPANGETRVAVVAQFVRVDSATGVFNMEAGGNRLKMRAGRLVRFGERYSELILSNNTNVEITGLLAYGFGDIEDRDFAEVTVSNVVATQAQNLTAELSVNTYVGAYSYAESLPAGDFQASVAFVNDTGEDLWITKLAIVGDQHSAGGAVLERKLDLIEADDVFIILAGRDGSEAIKIHGLRDKSNVADSEAIGVFRRHYISQTETEDIGEFPLLASGPLQQELFSESEPFLLKDSRCLMLINRHGGSVGMAIEAKPSAAAQSAGSEFAYSGTGLNYLTIPTFAETAGDANNVVRAALRATTADEAGISNATQYSATMDITADGIDPNGVRGLTYDISASDAALQAGGRMSVLLDQNFNIDGFDPASTQYLASVQHFNLQFKGNQRFRFQLGSAIPEISTEDIFIGGAGKPSEWQVDINWNGFDIELFFDGLPVLAHTFTAWGATFASNMYGAGLTSIANDYEGNRIKDLLLTSEPFTFINANESVMFLGDSLTTQGSPPVFMTAPQAGWASPDWLPTNNQGGFAGFSGVDNSNSSPSFTTDEGLVCSFMRKLFKAGIRPTNNTNFARTGDDVGQQVGQVALLTGAQNPTLAVCHLGTNNAADNQPASQFVSEYQTLITELEGEGIARMIICTVPSMESSAGGAVDRSGQVYRDAVDSYNAEIDGLIAWSIAQGYSIQIHKADVFTALGGHAINPSHFKVADLHYAEPGSNIAGDTAGDVAVAALTA